jgi:hypothetical protein
MTRAAIESQVLNEIDAAIYIGMSVHWLRKRRQNGTINAPHFCRCGRSIKYMIVDLNAFLERNRCTATVQNAA